MVKESNVTVSGPLALSAVQFVTMKSDRVGLKEGQHLVDVVPGRSADEGARCEGRVVIRPRGRRQLRARSLQWILAPAATAHSEKQLSALSGEEKGRFAAGYQ